MKLRYFPGVFPLMIGFVLVSKLATAATITVTEKGDSLNAGNCSLRDAIQSVNTGISVPGCSFSGTLGNNDTINLEAGDYTLSLPSSSEDNNADGDLDILKPVVILGAGADLTNITGGFPAGEEDRILSVCPNALCESNPTDTSVQISNLTVSNGGASNLDIGGAGILAGEPFQAASQVMLTLADCVVRDNLSDLTTGNLGGGILNDFADIRIERCQVMGNQGSNGGGINSLGGVLAIHESTIEDNDAWFGGGGIRSSGMLLVYNSTIANNRALPDSAPSFGGGISVAQVCNFTTVIANSTISGNQANLNGGGIHAQACVDDLVFSSDKVGANGTQPGVFLFNNTIATNEVTGTDSEPGAGGGIYFDPQNGLGTGLPGSLSVGIYNSIVAQNTAASGPDCFDSLESGGFNLIGDDTDCMITSLMGNPDQTNIDPLLGPLQDNGGPTHTHGLSDGSPAIDMGNNLPGEGCQVMEMEEVISNNFGFFPLGRDQRDFPRPIAVVNPADPICDVGAFEFQTFDFEVTKDDGLGGNPIQVGGVFTYTINVTNNGPGTATAVTLEDSLPEGIEFNSVTTSQGTCSGGAVVSCDLGELSVGDTATIEVNVTASATGTYPNTVTVTLNNPFQAQLNETAQITTTVIGDGLLEGGGCGLQHGEAPAGRKVALAFGLMTLVLLGANLRLRSRIKA